MMENPPPELALAQGGTTGDGPTEDILFIRSLLMFAILFPGENLLYPSAEQERPKALFFL